MAGGGGEGDLTKAPSDRSLYGTFAPPLPPPPSSHAIQVRCQPLPPPPPPAAAAAAAASAAHYQRGLVNGIPLMEPPLPFCGIGVGWALFLSGFLLAAIPWYLGAFILFFVALDYREKPGLIACAVAVVTLSGDVSMNPRRCGSSGSYLLIFIECVLLLIDELREGRNALFD